MAFPSTLAKYLTEVTVCCVVGVLDRVFATSLHPCFRGHGAMCTLNTFFSLN